jgi:aminotransferase in exopolysaccharide biosynthesis
MSDRVIPLSEPYFSGHEGAYLEECLRTNYVSSVGPFVERFEREFAAYVGSDHAVACSSGTAALHVALRVVGVGPGDEVFVPALTFIASANAVSYLGGRATLVDSEETTWNMDPALVVGEIERRIRGGHPLPKAIEVVHLLGHPADVEPLIRICADHDIALVEDAAEALGARYWGGPLDGRHVGTVGDIGCFSFNGNKIITTGGGGMIVTDDADLARRAKHLTTQARVPGLAYEHDEIGYNYRLSNIAAALGVAQLEQLPDFLEAKRRIAGRYDQALRDCPSVELAPRTAWADPSWWLYSIRLGDRALASKAIGRLVDDGIGARPVWTPLHELAPYRDASMIGDGSAASSIAATGVSLPSSTRLDPDDQSRVIESLLLVLGEG